MNTSNIDVMEMEMVYMWYWYWVFRDFSVCDLIERNSGERWESSMGDTVPCETWLDRSEATRCSTGL